MRFINYCPKLAWTKHEGSVCKACFKNNVARKHYAYVMCTFFVAATVFTCK